MKRKSRKQTDADLAKIKRFFELFKIASPKKQRETLNNLSEVIEGETHKDSKEIFIKIKKHLETLQAEVKTDEN